MGNLVYIITKNEEGFDKSAVYMPVKVGGEPIGFISNVDEDKIMIALWKSNWVFAADEYGKFMYLDIKPKNEILPLED